MGMAASQGRLLFMTARISNNEFEQQAVAYSKQRLADDSQEANDQYLEALQQTEYQVLTGYYGDTAQYEAVSYNILTGFNNVAQSKQYIISDNRGRIVVPAAIAQAFENSKHNYNLFLETVESSQGNHFTQVSEENITEGIVHDAWDKYLSSINRGDVNGIYADEVTSANKLRHIVGFSYNEVASGDSATDYVTYNTSFIGSGAKRVYLNKDKDNNYYYNNYKVEVESYIDANGLTQYAAYFQATEEPQENSEKWYLNEIQVEASGNDFIFKDSNGNRIQEDSNGNIYVEKQDFNLNNTVNVVNNATTNRGTASATTEKNILFYEGGTPEQRQLYDYAMALNKKFATQYKPNATKLTYDADKVQYYKNIFNEMTTKGYTTYDDMIKDKYINTEAESETTPFASNEWLVRYVKQGKFVISFYSKNDESFIKTTLDDDESIVNKEDKSKMAIAEQIYQTHMDKIEAEDKRFDMELTKLESEHSALVTEYDSVAKVISKNVEKSFGIFNA